MKKMWEAIPENIEEVVIVANFRHKVLSLTEHLVHIADNQEVTVYGVAEVFREVLHKLEFGVRIPDPCAMQELPLLRKRSCTPCLANSVRDDVVGRVNSEVLVMSGKGNFNPSAEFI